MKKNNTGYRKKKKGIIFRWGFSKREKAPWKKTKRKMVGKGKKEPAGRGLEKKQKGFPTGGRAIPARPS